jgi:hypothetical protein
MRERKTTKLKVIFRTFSFLQRKLNDPIRRETSKYDPGTYYSNYCSIYAAGVANGWSVYPVGASSPGR